MKLSASLIAHNGWGAGGDHDTGGGECVGGEWTRPGEWTGTGDQAAVEAYLLEEQPRLVFQHRGAEAVAMLDTWLASVPSAHASAMVPPAGQTALF